MFYSYMSYKCLKDTLIDVKTAFLIAAKATAAIYNNVENSVLIAIKNTFLILVTNFKQVLHFDNYQKYIK